MLQTTSSLSAVVGLLCASFAAGQSTTVEQRRGSIAPEEFSGGVPLELADAAVLSLTLADSIRRGLDRNLGVLLSSAAVQGAQGERRQSRSALMPHLVGAVDQSRRKVNLSVFGFPPSADRPSVVGPFNVFDARLLLEWTLYDAERWSDFKESSSRLQAAELTRRDAVDLLTLVVSDAYLRTLAWRSQVGAVRAQLRTSTSLAELASSRRSAGLVAGIEVLRAEVQLRRDEQRIIAAENDLAKQRLLLARAIGLPLGQRFELVDSLGQRPAPTLDSDRALELAYAARTDLRAAEAGLSAARHALRAARGERYPEVVLAGDYGRAGNERDSSEEVFDVGLGVRIPLFVGGRIGGEKTEAEAAVRSEEARLADLQSQIYYDVQTVLLDLDATARAIVVTRSALDLTEQQLEQAKDRFAAGVADNLETVEAQEAVATANEEWILSVYRHDLTLAVLDRVLGEGGLEAASVPARGDGS